MALVPCQVLRVAILLSYFSILCNYKAIDMPAHQTYGGSWKFLTFINLQLKVWRKRKPWMVVIRVNPN
ncbi:androgen-induced gene 1 protein isoform X8 [Hemicordylus capensis]|uniref:androgen-induced gene 1 protein isoform X8 n=1 Tax=Hemicordylus capensis TaxID=884348 RepID=UPI002303D654|nr:androgen-induced gene 1 protein isoform X8 [Hemicordylus capensis]XP_053146277.1 androgen-induced gene 1 protein isoform X8 [Hemicordylus capensis]